MKSAVTIASLLLVVPLAAVADDCHAEDAIVHVASLIALIASPERYDMKYVSVSGVVAVGSDGTDLYLHREDFENRITPNAVILQGENVNSKRLHGKRARVRGCFQAALRGPAKIYAGTITEVDHFDEWPAP